MTENKYRKFAEDFLEISSIEQKNELTTNYINQEFEDYTVQELENEKQDILLENVELEFRNSIYKTILATTVKKINDYLEQKLAEQIQLDTENGRYLTWSGTSQNVSIWNLNPAVNGGLTGIEYRPSLDYNLNKNGNASSLDDLMDKVTLDDVGSFAFKIPYQVHWVYLDVEKQIHYVKDGDTVKTHIRVKDWTGSELSQVEQIGRIYLIVQNWNSIVNGSPVQQGEPFLNENVYTPDSENQGQNKLLGTLESFTIDNNEMTLVLVPDSSFDLANTISSVVVSDVQQQKDSGDQWTSTIISDTETHKYQTSEQTSNIQVGGVPDINYNLYSDDGVLIGYISETPSILRKIEFDVPATTSGADGYDIFNIDEKIKLREDVNSEASIIDLYYSEVENEKNYMLIEHKEDFPLEGTLYQDVEGLSTPDVSMTSVNSSFVMELILISETEIFNIETILDKISNPFFGWSSTILSNESKDKYQTKNYDLASDLTSEIKINRKPAIDPIDGDTPLNPNLRDNSGSSVVYDGKTYSYPGKLLPLGHRDREFFDSNIEIFYFRPRKISSTNTWGANPSTTLGHEKVIVFDKENDNELKQIIEDAKEVYLFFEEMLNSVNKFTGSFTSYVSNYHSIVGIDEGKARFLKRNEIIRGLLNVGEDVVSTTATYNSISSSIGTPFTITEGESIIFYLNGSNMTKGSDIIGDWEFVPVNEDDVLPANLISGATSGTFNIDNDDSVEITTLLTLNDGIVDYQSKTFNIKVTIEGQDPIQALITVDDNILGDTPAPPVSPTYTSITSGAVNDTITEGESITFTLNGSNMTNSSNQGTWQLISPPTGLINGDTSGTFTPSGDTSTEITTITTIDDGVYQGSRNLEIQININGETLSKSFTVEDNESTPLTSYTGIISNATNDTIYEGGSVEFRLEGTNMTYGESQGFWQLSNPPAGLVDGDTSGTFTINDDSSVVITTINTIDDVPYSGIRTLTFQISIGDFTDQKQVTVYDEVQPVYTSITTDLSNNTVTEGGTIKVILNGSNLSAGNTSGSWQILNQPVGLIDTNSLNGNFTIQNPTSETEYEITSINILDNQTYEGLRNFDVKVTINSNLPDYPNGWESTISISVVDDEQPPTAEYTSLTSNATNDTITEGGTVTFYLNGSNMRSGSSQGSWEILNLPINLYNGDTSGTFNIDDDNQVDVKVLTTINNNDYDGDVSFIFKITIEKDGTPWELSKTINVLENDQPPATFTGISYYNSTTDSLENDLKLRTVSESYSIDGNNNFSPTVITNSGNGFWEGETIKFYLNASNLSNFSGNLRWEIADYFGIIYQERRSSGSFVTTEHQLFDHLYNGDESGTPLTSTTNRNDLQDLNADTFYLVEESARSVLTGGPLHQNFIDDGNGGTIGMISGYTYSGVINLDNVNNDEPLLFLTIKTHKSLSRWPDEASPALDETKEQWGQYPRHPNGYGKRFEVRIKEWKSSFTEEYLENSNTNEIINEKITIYDRESFPWEHVRIKSSAGYIHKEIGHESQPFYIDPAKSYQTTFQIEGINLGQLNQVTATLELDDIPECNPIIYRENMFTHDTTLRNLFNEPSSYYWVRLAGGYTTSQSVGNGEELPPSGTYVYFQRDDETYPRARAICSYVLGSYSYMHILRNTIELIDNDGGSQVYGPMDITGKGDIQDLMGVSNWLVRWGDITIEGAPTYWVDGNNEAIPVNAYWGNGFKGSFRVEEFNDIYNYETGVTTKQNYDEVVQNELELTVTDYEHNVPVYGFNLQEGINSNEVDSGNLTESEKIDIETNALKPIKYIRIWPTEGYAVGEFELWGNNYSEAYYDKLRHNTLVDNITSGYGWYKLCSGRGGDTNYTRTITIDDGGGNFRESTSWAYAGETFALPFNESGWKYLYLRFPNRVVGEKVRLGKIALYYYDGTSTVTSTVSQIWSKSNLDLTDTSMDIVSPYTNTNSGSLVNEVNVDPNHWHQEWYDDDENSGAYSFLRLKIELPVVRKTPEEWVNNPDFILNYGQFGIQISSSNYLYKVGDGVTKWEDLDYVRTYDENGYPTLDDWTERTDWIVPKTRNQNGQFVPEGGVISSEPIPIVRSLTYPPTSYTRIYCYPNDTDQIHEGDSVEFRLLGENMQYATTQGYWQLVNPPDGLVVGDTSGTFNINDSTDVAITTITTIEDNENDNGIRTLTFVIHIQEFRESNWNVLTKEVKVYDKNLLLGS